MKTYLLLFILGITQVTAAVFSQNININLSLKNTPLKEAFEQIENKTDFKFLYRSDLIDMDHRTTLDISGTVSIDALMAHLLKGTNAQYSLISENLIVLAPQQRQLVMGIVRDSRTRESIPGVNVLIEGTMLGTV
ncbi:MAG: hypothetical protein Q7V19_17160, partial [Bacteroidales bacterium]|nr:hypothetical protein [Bacteroidales bacterium]